MQRVVFSHFGASTSASTINMVAWGTKFLSVFAHAPAAMEDQYTHSEYWLGVWQ